jgi:hypothetical protein
VQQALCLYAGPKARDWIARNGLSPADIAAIPGAAGGPKGLVLGPLDRFLFGDWLPRSHQPIDLVGASIGAWRMATACMDDAVAGFARLERDYIAQHYEIPPGRKRPAASAVSAQFGANLQDFYGLPDGPGVRQVLQHPRYRLHVLTSRGRHLLRREHGVATPLGYLGAFVSNTVHRRAMGAWIERVVFSSAGAALPFAADGYRTRQLPLTAANFHPVLQASCSIPFVLQAVHDIPGAPRGAYWDGGITDYHLHLNYAAGAAATSAAAGAGSGGQGGGGLVLYPHFQRAVVPGWLDKGLRWRHHATPFLDTMLLLAPHPEWVRSLPRGKLPDRKDFEFHATDPAARMRDWNTAVAASRQLADEFAQWLERPDPARLLPL